MSREKVKTYYLRSDSLVKSYRIDYKEHLNPEQLEVVMNGDGPCLVLAGAGSGKTRTLIYRLAYLLETGISPQNILLMTFTNKAARHMQNRIELLLGYRPKGLWSGTFHHIGNRCIRLYASYLGLTKGFGILDEEDTRNLIKMCIKDMKADSTRFKIPSPAVIQSIISFSRNSKQDIEDTIYEQYPHLVGLTKFIKEVFGVYQQRKRKSNTLDYDDLLTEWIRLLETVPSARERFTRQFRYILVDEYQDTNFLQFDILKLLWSYHKNILVVGDDAQSIYSFRAAQIKNILEFPSVFKGTRIFKLQTNYRSVKEILDLANNIIIHNKGQFHKELVGVRNTNSGQRPILVTTRDLQVQAEFVAQRVLELRDSGIGLNEIAVLYRAHYQSAELQFELTKRGIPFITRGGIRFFEQAHIKDVLAFLKILHNPSDEISWLRALCLYPNIGTTYAERIFQRYISIGGSLNSILKKDFITSLPKRITQSFDMFKKTMRAILKEGVDAKPDLLIEIILKSGYREYVLLNYENAQDRIDDLHELINFAHTYETLKEFLVDITLRESFKGETMNGVEIHKENEYLVLSTIHQAKGLEWKAVFLIGLCEGQFPHPKSIDNLQQLEEERRLFYVTVTRAKDILYLVRPSTRYDYNYGTVITRPSLFLKELDKKLYERWCVKLSGSYDLDTTLGEEIFI